MIIPPSHNAIIEDFCADNAELTFRTPNNKNFLNKAVAEKDDGRIMLTTSDNGRGIQPEILPRIFTHFSRRSRRTVVRGWGCTLFNLVTQKLGEEIQY